MDKFLKYKIKEYAYWSVYIYQNQGYLGRSVIWCRREDALDLVDATLEEKEELFIILRELREGLKKTFQPDWFNYSFLGNETKHLHCHIVPRYASERSFAGVTFKDKRWGNSYRIDHDLQIPDDVVERIRVQIKKAIK